MKRHILPRKNQNRIFSKRTGTFVPTLTLSEMFKLFSALSKNLQTTFLIITHNNKLAKMCNRIINIKDGEIIEQ